MYSLATKQDLGLVKEGMVTGSPAVRPDDAVGHGLLDNFCFSRLAQKRQAFLNTVLGACVPVQDRPKRMGADV